MPTDWRTTCPLLNRYCTWAETQPALGFASTRRSVVPDCVLPAPKYQRGCGDGAPTTTLPPRMGLCTRYSGNSTRMDWLALIARPNCAFGTYWFSTNVPRACAATVKVLLPGWWLVRARTLSRKVTLSVTGCDDGLSTASSV